MAIGSGLAAQLGLAEESTYGTYVAPTTFLEFNSEDLKLNKTTVQGGGLAAGRYVDLGSRRVLTTKSGSGTVDLEVTNKSFGKVFKHLLGAVNTTGTGPYTHTFTVGDNYGLGLTVQKGIPETTGTVRPYSFTGGKIVSAAFMCEVQGMLTAQIELDFQDVTEAQTLATASYTTGLTPFHGGEMVVKMGSVGSETAISGVKKVDLKFERGMDTERFYAESATSPKTKAEPVMNSTVGISGSLDIDFVDKTEVADLFAADSNTSLVIEWTKSGSESLSIQVPMIFLDSETPSVGGPEVVSTTFAFTGQDNGTNEVITATYLTADSTP